MEQTEGLVDRNVLRGNIAGKTDLTECLLKAGPGDWILRVGDFG